MTRVSLKWMGPRLVLGALVLTASVGLATGSSVAQQVAVSTDQQDSAPRQDPAPHKPSAKHSVVAAVATSDAVSSSNEVKPIRRPQVGASAKGPYYVDFRARTAATYGHAFVWFGKTSDKKVEVAGLWPQGDEVPYMLGHLMWVPAGTGATYGDLDVQYLTASYRVYLSEADAMKTFAYIKHLQETNPLWNAETTNCTAFIGQIASFMGLKTPFHLQKPEAYVNQLRDLNGGRQTAQLSSDR
jgi:hypothetical protein